MLIRKKEVCSTFAWVMLHEIIENSHLCNTSHLQGIPELINKYIKTDIFCNMLPSCDNFLPRISDHLTNSNQAFNTLCCCTAKGMGSAEGTQPWAWGKGSRSQGSLACSAPVQQRFLLNKVLNHIFKSALMDVSMASSTLLNVSVGRKRTWEKCGAECEHQWLVKAAPACQLFVIITSGYTWIIPVNYFSCVLHVMKITKYPQTHHHFINISPHL